MRVLLVLLAVTASVAHGRVYRNPAYRSDGCPEPYERLDETRCVLADPFKTRNYADAVEYCSGHGGNLLTYDDCADQLLIWDYIMSDTTLSAKHYWLGATDEAEEGQWVFTHSQNAVPMGNPFWKNGEPSVTTTNNCAILHASYSHRWADIACTGSYNTICLRDG